MPAPNSLKEVYTDEIKDLWSANEQMKNVLGKLSDQANNAKLKGYLKESVSGIDKHNQTLKSLLQEAGGTVETEHCKGMEGLVKEALKHCVEEAPSQGELKDIVIVSQYQRMCHYGITGFGTAATFANALGMKDAESKLKSIVSDIYKSDEYTTQLGEMTAKMAAH